MEDSPKYMNDNLSTKKRLYFCNIHNSKLKYFCLENDCKGKSRFGCSECAGIGDHVKHRLYKI